MLALERQEVDGRCTTMNSSAPPTRDGSAKTSINAMLFRVSDIEVPEFRDAPKVVDLLKSDAERKALELLPGRRRHPEPDTSCRPERAG